jgi:hypothetical protein
MKLPVRAKASLIMCLLASAIEAFFCIHAATKPHVSEDYELMFVGLISFGVAILLHIISVILGLLSLRQTKLPLIWLTIPALHVVLAIMVLTKG